MSQARIRRLEAPDLDWVMPIENEAFVAPWTSEAVLSELDTPHACCLALQAPGGEWVGYAIGRVVFEDAHLLALAVASQARRSGFAQALLARFEHEARTRGASGVFLEVRVGNGPARALYERCGYKAIALRPRYYSDGEDAILLSKGLADGEAE
jgi:ribosomal-protein-alanine N-acetyltransferase